MSKNIGVLYVASEADPFIKTGTIGELAGNLPKSIKAQGHDIRVMLPGYGSINSRRFQIHNLLRMRDIDVPVGTDLERAYIKSSYLNSETQKVLVYFLANDRYYNRQGLYFHPDSKKHFTDNDERFIFFCRGVLETLKRLQWQPQVIHCHDWQCGLIPAYLKTIYKDDPYFRNIKTVFTVYSLASYASFPKSTYAKAGLSSSLFESNGGTNGKFNFLKAGLTFADVVTTMGVKADKGIRLAPQDGMGEIMSLRKTPAVSMMSEGLNGNGQTVLAQKFIDLYRDLVKHPG